MCFGADGLVPVVVQDATTDAVLMVAFMNQEAFDLTRETGKVHFWSRSRSKLWRKGETSGHEQLVREFRMNCNGDSLLVRVDQMGACCHTGHSSCYYRRLEEDGSLTLLTEPVFDPESVYGPEDGLSSRLRIWYGAYLYLRDHDLSNVSGTSRALRGDGSTLTGRLADELHELAGVIRGEHHHSGLLDDVVLEASQALYWLALVAAHAGVAWLELDLPTALGVERDAKPVEDVAERLDADAIDWRDTGARSNESLIVALRATAGNIQAAAASAQVEIATVIEHDLAELRSRPYLESYFESTS